MEKTFKVEQLTSFNSEDFGEVRTVVKDGEPMFCLADVCKALMIKNASDVAKRLEDDELTRLNLGSKSGETWFINESGLYNVILRSDKAEARKFKKWVTSEVLPQIRKTGSYSAVDKTLLSPEMQILVSMTENLALQQIETKRLAESHKQLETKVDNICDIFTQTIGDWKEEINTKVREIAQRSNCDYKVLWNQLYGELEYRAKCNLGRLVDNKKKRLITQGLTKTAIEKETTKLAVIFDNQRIREIFTTIVKEFAIKYCA